MKDINWPLLVQEILERLLLSQDDLAKRCNVTQQTVSNWKNKIRNPGIYAKQKLVGIINEAGMEINQFKVKDNADKYSAIAEEHAKYREKDELKILTELFKKMSPQERREVIEYAYFKLRKTGNHPCTIKQQCG